MPHVHRSVLLTMDLLVRHFGAFAMDLLLGMQPVPEGPHVQKVQGMPPNSGGGASLNPAARGMGSKELLRRELVTVPQVDGVGDLPSVLCSSSSSSRVCLLEAGN